MAKQSKLAVAQKGFRLFQIIRSLLEPKKVRGENGELVVARDALGNFRTLTYAFVEGRIAQILAPLLIVEIVIIVLMVLAVVSIFQTIASKDTAQAIIVGILGVILFGLWQLVRWIRHFIERQVTRALAAFDRKVTQGVESVADWPKWYNSWKKRKTVDSRQ